MDDPPRRRGRREPSSALDAAQLNELYQQTTPALLRYARRWTPDEDAAEDLVQVVWARAWEKRDLYKGSGSARAWLWAITANAAKTHARSEGSRRRVNARALSQDAPLVFPAPDDNLKRKESTRRVNRWLECLSPRERTVVTARVLHEVPSRDVAAQLGISASTVRVHYYKALGRLRNALGSLESVPD